MKQMYFKWGMIICIVLLLFAIGILLLGYKAPSVGKCATIVVLAIGAILFGVLWRREQ